MLKHSETNSLSQPIDSQTFINSNWQARNNHKFKTGFLDISRNAKKKKFLRQRLRRAKIYPTSRSLNPHPQSLYLFISITMKVLSFISILKEKVLHKFFQNLDSEKLEIINDLSYEIPKKINSNAIRKNDRVRNTDPKDFFLRLYKLENSKNRKKGMHYFFKIKFEKGLNYIKNSIVIALTFYGKSVPVISFEARINYYQNIAKCIICSLLFIIIPLETCFNTSFFAYFSSDFEESSVKIFLMIMFFCDIAFKLNVGCYIDGEIQMDRKMILKNYWNKVFIGDFFCFIGLLLWYKYPGNSESPIKYCSLLLFWKIFEIYNCLSDINETIFINENTENILKLTFLLAKILFISHLLACLWFLISSHHNSESVWYRTISIIENKWTSRYIFALYWAVTTIATVGYGDITPQNQIEVLFTILTIIIGCGIFGYTLNSIGTIISSSNKNIEELKAFLREINGYMNENNISNELRTRVRKYLKFTWAKKNSKDNIEKELFNKIPENLTQDILYEGNSRVLSKLQFFISSFSEEFLQELNLIISHKTFTPEDNIAENEQIRNSLFLYIDQGEIDILAYSQKRNQPPTVLKKLCSGDIYGLLEFFTNKLINYELHPKKLSKVFYVRKETFLSLLNNFPKDKEIFYNIKDDIIFNKDNKKIKMKCIICNSLFHPENECNYIHYYPSKKNILDKYTQSEKNMRKYIIRKNYLKIKRLNIHKVKKKQSLNFPSLKLINESNDQNSNSSLNENFVSIENLDSDYSNKESEKGINSYNLLEEHKIQKLNSIIKKINNGNINDSSLTNIISFSNILISPDKIQKIWPKEVCEKQKQNDNQLIHRDNFQIDKIAIFKHYKPNFNVNKIFKPSIMNYRNSILITNIPKVRYRLSKSKKILFKEKT